MGHDSDEKEMGKGQEEDSTGEILVKPRFYISVKTRVSKLD